jgi:hypothetical protein
LRRVLCASGHFEKNLFRKVSERCVGDVKVSKFWVMDTCGLKGSLNSRFQDRDG